MALIHGWVRALKSGMPVRPFADMAMAPVETDLAIQAITALMQARMPGIFQLTGPADVTYEEAARHIAAAIGADPALIEPAAASSAGMPPGATPRHTVLDSWTLRDRFGIVAAGPWEVIDRIVANAESLN
jgi:dTDP-4-dehydrorhamnose reductase